MSILGLNQMAMESFRDIMNDQPSKDKLHYIDIVLEATNNAAKGALTQKLYTEIISKSNINFGKIPDSKGDLTKYEYYKTLNDSIDALNQILEGAQLEELAMLNKLFDMVISLRSDFEFGFKFDVEIIKLTYNTSVMSLFEMVNLCIMAYTNYLKDTSAISIDFGKVKKNDLLVTRSVASLLKLYENGEWAMILKQTKGDPSNLLGGLVSLDTVSKAVSVSKPVQVIAALIALLLSLRLLISLYYSSAAKIDRYVTTQKDFLALAIVNDTDNTDKSLTRQHKMLSKLESISNFIEVHILKSDSDAKKALTQSNKENFKKEELIGAGFGSGEINLF